MRKVLFRSPGGSSFDKPGFFHGLGQTLVNTNGQYFAVTVAFVETEELRLIKVDIEDLKFVEPMTTDNHSID